MWRSKVRTFLRAVFPPAGRWNVRLQVILRHPAASARRAIVRRLPNPLPVRRLVLSHVQPRTYGNFDHADRDRGPYRPRPWRALANRGAWQSAAPLTSPNKSGAGKPASFHRFGPTRLRPEGLVAISRATTSAIAAPQPTNCATRSSIAQDSRSIIASAASRNVSKRSFEGSFIAPAILGSITWNRR